VRETGVRLCDKHATGGARLSIIFEPTESNELELKTYGVGTTHTRHAPPPKADTEDVEDADAGG
jgi:hypothetical protein